WSGPRRRADRPSCRRPDRWRRCREAWQLEIREELRTRQKKRLLEVILCGILQEGGISQTGCVQGAATSTELLKTVASMLYSMVRTVPSQKSMLNPPRWVLPNCMYQGGGLARLMLSRCGG